MSGVVDPLPEDALLIETPDGSRTAFNSRFGEAYGSRHGAAAQAHHVFVGGTDTPLHPTPHILELGFGVGVNCRATLAALPVERPLEYVAYEFDPAPQRLLREVASGGEGEEHPLWQALLAEWEGLRAGQSPLTVQVGSQRITVHACDVVQAPLPQHWATALYLDGFSPDRNPELWTPDLLVRLANALQPGGQLATYSAAGRVRRGLMAAGLTVEKRPGPPGKREYLWAIRL